jgi:hypothetical protein
MDPARLVDDNASQRQSNYVRSTTSTTLPQLGTDISRALRHPNPGRHSFQQPNAQLTATKKALQSGQSTTARTLMTHLGSGVG